VYLCNIMFLCVFFLQTYYSIGIGRFRECYVIASAVKIMKFTIQNKKNIKNLPIRRGGHAYTRGKVKHFCII